ncbi:MAG TPA: hypothetical protein VF979_10715 [Streptosporangiaceae bacterium]
MTTSPGGIQAVSCATASQCVAIGSPGTRAVAKSWNGKSWRTIKTVNP